MASPTIDGRQPKMPESWGGSNGGKTYLVVDPVPNKKSTKLNLKPKPKSKKLGMKIQPAFSAPGAYTPIKQTKAVNKVYKTY